MIANLFFWGADRKCFELIIKNSKPKKMPGFRIDLHYIFTRVTWESDYTRIRLILSRRI